MKHGTTAAYDQHFRDNIPVCEDCRRAAARYENERRLDALQGIRRTVSSVGTARRMQALVALGWSFKTLGDMLQVSHDQARKWAWQTDTIIRATSAQRVAVVYDRLCMTPAPDSRNAKYARTVAARNGWVPPLAWDDIDDHDETPSPAWQPRCATSTIQAKEYDEVVVLRLLDGDTTIAASATKAEKVEALRRWMSWGRPERELCGIFGWHEGRYTVREDPAA